MGDSFKEIKIKLPKIIGDTTLAFSPTPVSTAPAKMPTALVYRDAVVVWMLTQPPFAIVIAVVTWFVTVITAM